NGGSQSFSEPTKSALRSSSGALVSGPDYSGIVSSERGLRICSDLPTLCFEISSRGRSENLVCGPLGLDVLRREGGATAASSRWSLPRSWRFPDLAAPGTHWGCI